MAEHLHLLPSQFLVHHVGQGVAQELFLLPLRRLIGVGAAKPAPVVGLRRIGVEQAEEGHPLPQPP
ncbi:hypothetical protein D3C71_1905730 [compost metagenome]